MNPFADRWTADACPDARGFVTVRFADGSEHGRTDCGPVATVYLDTLAPLVAAAPDLLAALELLQALEDAGAHDADTRWKQARQMRRAAIAKARGQ